MSTDGEMDGRVENVKPVYLPSNFVEAEDIMIDWCKEALSPFLKQWWLGPVFRCLYA